MLPKIKQAVQIITMINLYQKAITFKSSTCNKSEPSPSRCSWISLSDQKSKFNSGWNFPSD